MKGDQAAVRALLQQKADVNTAQADGATAIQWAAYRNDVDLAGLLIAAGANVKTPNREGATPLYIAAINGSPAMIEMPLKAGADPNERPARRSSRGEFLGSSINDTRWAVTQATSSAVILRISSNL